MTRFTIETKRPCLKCKRDVDAIRTTDAPGLFVSRHLKIGSGFCVGSLGEIAKRGA